MNIFNIVKFLTSHLNSINNRDLQVNVATSFSVTLGGKSRKVSIEAVAGVENPGFKHAGQIIVFEVPSAFASSI